MTMLQRNQSIKDDRKVNCIYLQWPPCVRSVTVLRKRRYSITQEAFQYYAREVVTISRMVGGG
jgi:hypothetical protein